MYDEVLYPAKGDDTSEVRRFVLGLGLGYDEDVELVVVIRNTSGEIVATGSLAGKVAKHLGVKPELEGTGLLVRVFDRLYQHARSAGQSKLLAITAPRSAHVLRSLGFSQIEATARAVLLEFCPGSSGLRAYLAGLPGVATTHNAGVVLNANPFSLGHLYLVTQAAKMCEHVFVFVVTEDRSLFPTEVRERLVRSGTEHLKNVTVLSGGDYIISQATFPMYFIRSTETAAEIQAELDAQVFARHIAPALKITSRYVGEEPYCATTRMYNDAMRVVFGRHGLELEVVPRLEVDGEAVSASRIRAAIRAADWQKVARLVPDTTRRFLQSAESLDIIRRIRESDLPH